MQEISTSHHGVNPYFMLLSTQPISEGTNRDLFVNYAKEPTVFSTNSANTGRPDNVGSPQLVKKVSHL